MIHSFKHFRIPWGEKPDKQTLALMLILDEQGLHPQHVTLYDQVNEKHIVKTIYRVRPDMPKKKK